MNVPTGFLPTYRASNATLLPVRADEADPLRFAFARAVIEHDAAARALPSFAVEPSTFALDEAVRALTAHLGYRVAE